VEVSHQVEEVAQEVVEVVQGEVAPVVRRESIEVAGEDDVMLDVK
tara:strand:- start:324 stop:458 length:135 start_codon:yes stop_codon:yes gene_type:complete